MGSQRNVASAHLIVKRAAALLESFGLRHFGRMVHELIGLAINFDEQTRGSKQVNWNTLNGRRERGHFSLATFKILGGGRGRDFSFRFGRK